MGNTKPSKKKLMGENVAKSFVATQQHKIELSDKFKEME